MRRHSSAQCPFHAENDEQLRRLPNEVFDGFQAQVSTNRSQFYRARRRHQLRPAGLHQGLSAHRVGGRLLDLRQRNLHIAQNLSDRDLAANLGRIRTFAHCTRARYVAVAPTRKMKNGHGRGTNPSADATGAQGRSAASSTTPSPVTTKGTLGRLAQGLAAVRMTKTTRTWVASDSTNQPVWN